MPLLYVLWTIALLTILAGVVQSSSVVSYTLVRNNASLAQQDALAEAGVNLAVLALLDPVPANQPSVDGSPFTLRFADTEMEVRIQDELGRIDINTAAPSLLAGLFRAAGASTQTADLLADRVVDWRDADSLRRLNGAEAEDYRQGGLAGRPRNDKFQSVDELKLVLGMTPDLHDRIEPAITVYSGKPTVAAATAPDLAWRALTGGTVDRPKAPSPLAGTLNGRAFSIRIAFTIGGTSASREAVVRLTGDPAKPYWLLDWRQHWNWRDLQ